MGREKIVLEKIQDALKGDLWLKDANLVVALTIDTDSYIDEVCCKSSLGGF